MILKVIAVLIVAVVVTLPKVEASDTIVFEGRTYPVVAVEQIPMQKSDFCTLVTGIWCDGTIGLPMANSIVVFDEMPVAYWHVS